MKSKKLLYNAIIKDIAKSVKKTINEAYSKYNKDDNSGELLIDVNYFFLLENNNILTKQETDDLCESIYDILQDETIFECYIKVESTPDELEINAYGDVEFTGEIKFDKKDKWIQVDGPEADTIIKSKIEDFVEVIKRQYRGISFKKKNEICDYILYTLTGYEYYQDKIDTYPEDIDWYRDHYDIY